MASSNRHAEISDINHGPLVNIAAWILMCMSVLFTSFRLISSFVLRGTAGKDDWIIVVATALAIAQSIATSLMVANGLGRHQDTLLATSLESYQKALLASSTLYVAALAFSKLSILILLDRLISMAQKRFRRLVRGTCMMILLYLVAEMFCLGFACDLPASWNYISGQCLDLVAFWDFDAAFNIATSIVIVAMPVMIVSPLQMKTGRKFQAITAFLFQAPICTFAGIRLMYLHNALGADDQTWASVDLQIWTQVNMHFSIIAANMPCLNIFLEGFQSVLFRQNIEGSGVGPTELASYPYARGNKNGDKNDRRVVSGSTEGIFLHDDGVSSASVKAVASSQFESDYVLRPEETEGRIYKTTEWTVLGTEGKAKRDNGDVSRY